MTTLKKLGRKIASINVLRTFWTSIRDFIFLLPAALAFAFTADLIERFATLGDGANWMTRVGNVFASLSQLCVAHLAVFILIAIGWPSLNRFGNFNFTTTWDALPGWGQLTMYVGVTVGWFIGCAIVIA